MNDIQDAWGRIANVIYAESPEEANKAYTKWADKFDTDINSTLCCVSNEELAENSLIHIKNNESAQLLDLAAGTGLAAEALLDHGYKGVMDAVELNEDMLKKAESKGIYRKHICFKITPGASIPVGQNIYDTVICSGALGANHLEEGCIVRMIHCLKPGGILVFNTRKTEANKVFVLKLDAMMKELVDIGQLSKIEVKEVLQFRSNCNETGDAMMAWLYIYKKL
ncbi:methyltransferase-like protein 27 [Styela clava]|uniref:uncharacterized protein LOC120348501 isoform X1 n=1 Tax=Styela clava TaxID=7725 RepID=UPI00193A7546|nr:uncharacterized protein LOC120348501 isoform X1 [Styela clava]XP_039274576.1 uncharacterized protein LOC120348501 isoform X1 [Styela clava]